MNEEPLLERTILAVDFSIQGIPGVYVVCRRQTHVIEDGAIRIQRTVIASLRLDDATGAAEFEEFLTVSAECYGVQAVSTTLARLARRKGIRLPPGLPVVDLAHAVE